ncbi:MAG: histidine phosphatase family protein [Bacteroidales bacterium]|nr:histidine phosphatase family protein [Bacteroidales bacterium]
MSSTEKILLIVRHGKALQDYRQIADIDRPLTERGILNNFSVARRLQMQESAPCLIVSSPAARALHTAHIFARVLGYPACRVQVDEDLYMHGYDAALSVLSALPQDVRSVMLVAHNPDMSCLANTFIPQASLSLPTSCVVSVRLDIPQWELLDQADRNCPYRLYTADN